MDFLVVLLPTKEIVFWPRVAGGAPSPDLASMVASEERLRSVLIQDLGRQGVAYVDLLEPLRHAPAQPYFVSLDGHPNALGHEVIGNAVAARLASQLGR